MTQHDTSNSIKPQNVCAVIEKLNYMYISQVTI